MYPWLIAGTTAVGGNSTAPTNLKSFCGGFINMVFIVSSMLSGACATPEFLMYMNYFIGLEYGQDYYKHPDKLADLSLKQRSIDKSSQTVSSKSYIPSTSLRVPAISKQFSGMWLIMTSIISIAFSSTLFSPTEANPTGIRLAGCRSVL